MKTSRSILSVTALACALVGASVPMLSVGAVAQETSHAGFVPEEVVVKTEEGYGVVAAPEADTLAEVQDLATDLEAEARVLEAGPNFAYEVQDAFVPEPEPGPEVEEPDPEVLADSRATGLDATPNDNFYTNSALQNNLKAQGFTAGWAKTHGWRNGSAVEVAVLDEGIHDGHPDLDGKIEAEKDFVNGDANASEGQGEDHGTFVSGVVAAETNTTPAKGMAGAGWGVRLDVAKVCDRGTCYTDAVAPAIDWAVNQGAKVVNMSFGAVRTGGGDSLVNSAIQRAANSNRLVVAAVGNDGVQTDHFWPASHPDVLGVGAIRSDNTPSRYDSGGSNLGGMVDVVAIDTVVTSLGEEGIVSTSNPGAATSCASDSCYTQGRGTSYATPQVSGAATLLYAQIDAPTDEKVSARLTNNASDLGPAGRDDQFGHGRLRVKCAFTPGATGC